MYGIMYTHHNKAHQLARDKIRQLNWKQRPSFIYQTHVRADLLKQFRTRTLILLQAALVLNCSGFCVNFFSTSDRRLGEQRDIVTRGQMS